MVSTTFMITLVSVLSLSVTLAEIFPLELWNFTEIDAGAKNAGMATPDEGESAPIRLGPTADRKGAHLGSAADGVKQSGKGSSDSASQALLGFTELVAGSQSLLNDNATGQSLATKTLEPFLTYYNGTVMSQLSADKPFWVYLIFYGKAWTQVDLFVIKNFIDSINPAQKPASVKTRHVRNWWLVTSLNFHDSDGRPITRDVRVRAIFRDLGSAYPLGSPSRPLSDRNIKNIVSNAVKSRFGTPNTRSAYFVLTDKNTHVTDFCTSSCSYHSAFRNFGKTIAYAHVGDPSTQCPFRCSFKYFTSRAKAINSLGADAAINWLAHELVDIATNPFQFAKRGVPGWIVSGTTIEVADFCEWDFGYTAFTPQGALYNIEGIKGKQYLIQRNFNRKLGSCKINADKGDDTAL